jgi:hypothetical protein
MNITLPDLLGERVDADFEDVWENERTPIPTRVLGMWLYSTGLSFREVVAVPYLPGLDRSRGAVWNWTRPSAETQSLILPAIPS